MQFYNLNNKKAGILVKRWTREENKLLKKNYKDKGPKYLSEKLGRSCESVRLQAAKLGLKYNARKWEVWEDRFLQRHFHEKSNASLGRTLKRTAQSIKYRGFKLKLTNQKPKWTEEEDKILREIYLNRSLSVEYIAKCVNRTPTAVLLRAASLNLHRTDKHNWTEEEHQYFMNNWKSKSYTEIAQFLKVSWEVVNYHAMSLGLRKRPTARLWTEEEKEFVRRNYKVIPNREIAEKLNRPVNVVIDFAGKFGLRNPPPRRWSEEDKDFLKKNYGILSQEEIAAKLGRTNRAVRWAASVFIKS